MEVLAACHIHSDWSYDGSWTLGDLANEFSSRGVGVLMMTEHDRGFSPSRFDDFREACARASDSRILVVPGIEYSDSDNRVHVLTWGGAPFLGEGLPTGEILEAVQEYRGVAVLAHPARRRVWSIFEESWGSRLLGIELWNRKYDGWAPGRESPELLRSTGAIPFVGLDFHTERQAFPLAMALNLQYELTEDAVIACLSRRDCYPTAFGAPLSSEIVARSLPLLKAAEAGRRKLASIMKGR